ncbi:MAG: molybdate ABC transporter substrate-binding protein [Acidimicrobiales bacterium]
MRRLTLIFSLLFASACQSSTNNGLTVMAASSFQLVAPSLADGFESETGTAVSFNLAGSQTLAAQINSGAPADVFLSANDLAATQAGDRLTQVQPLLTNRLAILVPQGNPRQITGLASLTDPDLVVVLADPSVPAGAYTAQALAAAGVVLQPASLDPSVASVATRVAEGEADAGVGYITDAANPRIQALPLGNGVAVEAEYVAGVIDDSARGARFLEWLSGDTASQILGDAGFTPLGARL